MPLPPITLDSRWNRWMSDLNGTPLLLGYRDEIDQATAESILLRAAGEELKLFLVPAPEERSVIGLLFDPDVSCESGEAEDGVQFAEIWRCPLARCLWTIGERELTNQYFRRNVLNCRDLLLASPHRQISNLFWWGYLHDPLAHAMANGAWRRHDSYIETARRVAQKLRDPVLFEHDSYFSYTLEPRSPDGA